MLRAKGPTEKVVVFTEFKPLLQVGGAGNACVCAGAAAAGMAVLMVVLVLTVVVVVWRWWWRRVKGVCSPAVFCFAGFLARWRLL